MNDIIRHAEQIDGFMPTGDLEVIYKLAQKHIQPGGIAVEIGSWKGRSSYVLASVCKEKGAKLICIDTWAGSPHRDYDTYREALLDPDAFFNNNIKANLSDFADVVEFIREDSITAHRHIEDNSLDLCFVDGDHDDPGVSYDIRFYLPKVKPGGMFFGHDYFDDDRNDVRKAVEKVLDDEYSLIGGIWTHQKQAFARIYYQLSRYWGPGDYLKNIFKNIVFDKDFSLYIEPVLETNENVWLLDNHRLEGTQNDYISNAKHLLYTQPAYKDFFESRNKNSHLLMFGVDPEIWKRHEAIEPTYDIGFIGEPDNRQDWLTILKKEFPNNLVASGINHPYDVARELSHCKVLINKSRRGEINMRVFEGMAIGPLITDKVDYLDQVGVDGTDFHTYESTDQCVLKIHQLLNSHKQRKFIEKHGRETILKKHTYQHRANDIIKELGISHK